MATAAAKRPRTTPAEAVARLEAAIAEEELPPANEALEAEEAAARAAEPPTAPTPLPPAPPGNPVGPPVLLTPPGARLEHGTYVVNSNNTTNLTRLHCDHVWCQWMLPYLAHSDACWNGWTGTATAVTTTATRVLWLDWNNSLTMTMGSAAAAPSAPTLLTPAQAAQAEQRRQQQAAQVQQAVADRAVRVRYREEADRRARKLLAQYLSPQQRRQLARDEFFDLLAPSGRIYRIMRGTHGNVREMVRLPNGQLRAVASLCCQPAGVPEADAHLTQLLWLKSDEEAFRRIANIRTYDPNPQVVRARAVFG